MQFRSRLAAVAATVALLAGSPADAQTPVAPAAGGGGSAAQPASGVLAWRIDRSHSDITFRVRHLVSRVAGTFERWTADLQADPADWSTGTVSVSIEAASIDTRHERRDTHLRSDDFFDVETYPALTFQSRRVTTEGERIRVEGDLTIRGVTRPVVLEGELLALTQAPDGRRRVGFHATTRVNRHDFGVSWNRAAEGGGLVLADDVDIEINLAAVAP